VDFEVERFDILQVPFNLQMWVSYICVGMGIRGTLSQTKGCLQLNKFGKHLE